MGTHVNGPLHYAILDPTGNVTALVEDEVAVGLQPEVAARVMERHPEVEQVGFVRMAPLAGKPEGTYAQLRMAGGEFCGNATMSTAALWALRAGEAAQLTCEVMLRVCGASRPVAVRLGRGEDGSFDAGVRMPQALDIQLVRLEAPEARVGADALTPVVMMEGISHAVIEESSPLYYLREERDEAVRLVRRWCQMLGADGLGLMFLGPGTTERDMEPLVFVPGSDTVVWERSCASGSSAVGMLLAQRRGGPVSVRLREPGGTLVVESDPAEPSTWLYGSVRLVGEFTLS